MSTTTQVESEPVATQIENPEAVSRDPGDYIATEHFIIRKRKRDIEGWKIRDAIENGDIRNSTTHDDRIIFDSDHIGLIVEDNEVVSAINDNQRGADRY